MPCIVADCPTERAGSGSRATSAAPARLMDPLSIGTQPMLMIASVSGFRPVISRSMASSGAALTRSVASGSPRPPPARSFRSSARQRQCLMSFRPVMCAPGSEQVAQGQRLLRLADDAERRAEVTSVQPRKLVGVDQVIGRLAGFQLARLVLEPNVGDEFQRMDEVVGIAGGDQPGVGRGLEAFFGMNHLQRAYERANPSQVDNGNHAALFQVESSGLFAAVFLDELAEQADRRLVAKRLAGQEAAKDLAVARLRQQFAMKPLGQFVAAGYRAHVEEYRRLHHRLRRRLADPAVETPPPLAESHSPFALGHHAARAENVAAGVQAVANAGGQALEVFGGLEIGRFTQ